jgi:hypothetical protein
LNAHAPLPFAAPAARKSAEAPARANIASIKLQPFAPLASEGKALIRMHFAHCLKTVTAD